MSATSRHSASERQPSTATSGLALSSSASGLSMPAAVKPAACAGAGEASEPVAGGNGPGAGSNTVTACPSLASRQASRRPSTPAPAMPIFKPAMVQALGLIESTGT